MRPIQVVLDVLPANTQSVSVQAENAPASNAVALAQTLADGGSLTIDGTFAAEWIAENEAGCPNYHALQAAGKEHQIEKVGAELRAMMPFISAGKQRVEDASGG